jgi:phosphoribosylanthranilate isomerase
VNIKKTLDHAHKIGAQAQGLVIYQIVKRRVHRGTLIEAINLLHEAAQTLQLIVDDTTKKE